MKGGGGGTRCGVEGGTVRWCHSLHPNIFQRPLQLNNTSQTSRKRSERPERQNCLPGWYLSMLVRWWCCPPAIPRPPGLLRCLPTRPSSQQLSCRTEIAEPTVTGRHVTPVLARLRETGRHLMLVAVEEKKRSTVDPRLGRNRDRRTSRSIPSKLLPQRSSAFRSSAFQHAIRLSLSPAPSSPSCRGPQVEVDMSLPRQNLLRTVRVHAGRKLDDLCSSLVAVGARCRCRRRGGRHSLCRCGFLMDGSQHTSQSIVVATLPPSTDGTSLQPRQSGSRISNGRSGPRGN